MSAAEIEPLAAGATPSDNHDVVSGDEESTSENDKSESRAPETTFNDRDAPLTVKLIDYIRPDQEEEYLAWQRGISGAMEDVVGRDNVGSILLREMLSDGRCRFVILFRFRNLQAAYTWHQSQIRIQWLQKLKDTSFHMPPPLDGNDASAGEHFKGDTSSYHPIPIFDVTEPIPDDDDVSL